MKEIPLTKGYVALVDDEDYEGVSRFKWHARPDRRTVYASRWVYLGGGVKDKKQKLVHLHHFVLGIDDLASPEVQVDHEDHNGLNCQKCNLRVATTTQNLANQQKTRGTSQYKGVYWQASRRKWVAKIKLNKKSTWLGRFASEEAAARAYDSAARQMFGEFCLLNFPT